MSARYTPLDRCGVHLWLAAAALQTAAAMLKDPDDRVIVEELLARIAAFRAGLTGRQVRIKDGP